MANFLTDNQDLQYYLQEGIDWEPLVALTELGYRLPDGWKSSAEALTFYRDTSSMVGELVADEIAPHADLRARTKAMCEELKQRGPQALAALKAAFHARHNGAAGLSRVSIDHLVAN